MEKKVVLRNVICSLLLQAVTILSGFIIPKIILNDFGSSVNGLVSSINQFLNYIKLLEGGLSGVIMAALYKPLNEGDHQKVSAIVKATASFFRKVGIIYVVYALALGLVYPLVVGTGYSYEYSVALILVLGMNLFVQYFFSLTYKLLLSADRKVFFVSLTQTLIIVLNTVSVWVCSKLFHDILLLKFATALIFLIQPLFFTTYVRKHYHLDQQAEPDQQALSQRWDGFGVNIAYFIHTNTDIVILTVFSTLANISVYSVHLMVVNALKNLIVSISSAISPSFGKVLAEDNHERLNRVFDQYEYWIYLISTILFTCGMILLTPFVMLYTSNIHDADYHQKAFGIILALSEMVYCIRDPYVSASYAAGHFKQISKYAYIEAALNIVMSVALVFKFGIIGIAVGTLLSMIFRMLAHIWYLKKNIVNRNVTKAIKPALVFTLTTVLCYFGITKCMTLDFTSYVAFFVNAFIIFCVVTIVNVGISFPFFKKQFMGLIKR